MGGTKIDDHCMTPLAESAGFSHDRLSDTDASMSIAGIRYFLRLFKEEIMEQLKDKPSRRR